MKEITSCPNCKREFEQKRRNQIYCRTKCRMEFNNRKYIRENSRFSEFNRLLRRNYRIICDLIKDSDSVDICKDDLLKLGYEINLMTHIEVMDKKDYRGIYDFYLCRTKDNIFKITRS